VSLKEPPTTTTTPDPGLFNAHVLFENFTERLLSFNGRYDPLVMHLGLQTSKGHFGRGQ